MPCARPRDLSHHGLARAPVGALAGKAGGVGGVSLHCDLIQLKMGEPA